MEFWDGLSIFFRDFCHFRSIHNCCCLNFFLSDGDAWYFLKFKFLVLWLQFWFVYCSQFETWKTQSAIQISSFFDDEFFSCSFIGNLFFWLWYKFPRNQYEMSGKSDIRLWCLIQVLWDWFVDSGQLLGKP